MPPKTPLKPPNPQPSPSTERRWTQEFVTGLIRLAPLGSSVAILGKSLVTQDWWQAVFMFPLTVASAVWAGYSKAFLEEIGKRSEERGRQDAGAMADRFDRAMRKTLDNPDAKYLECQRRDCIYNDIEGYEQRNVLLLRDVFVPLKLSPSGLGLGPMGSRQGAIGEAAVSLELQLEQRLLERQHLTIWDLLRQVRRANAYSRLAILAQGGYGKTTLLRHIAFTYATGRDEEPQFQGVPKLVPMLLYLRKWREVIAPGLAPSSASDLSPQSSPAASLDASDETGAYNPKTTPATAPDLPQLIMDHHIPDLPGGEELDLPADWAREHLVKGSAIVMIDGFDEVAESQRVQVSQWINRQMHRYPNSIFILTSRPGGYKYYQSKSVFKRTVFVNAFEPDQWKQFIRQWYICQERARRMDSENNLTTVKTIAIRKANQLIGQIEAPKRSDLADMVTNPLLLNMITTWHQFRPGGKLPRYRAELYQSICELQLGSRPEAKQVDLLLPVKESQRVLQWLALKMQTEERTQVSEKGLLSFFDEALKGLDCPETIKPDRFLHWMCQVSELLVERNTQEYEFSHRSFQSYLAAVEIGQRNKEEGLLDQWDKKQDWWHETIILYVAQLDNPNLAIQGLVDRKAVDLAYKCVQESSRRIDPKLRSVLSDRVKAQVQDLRFEALENYLKAGNLQEADQETYRLMIKTVGKEEGNYFTSEELLIFPCEELLRIDDLWIKYSNGKFGFSVQEKIYVECGGKLDGKYPGNEIFNRFYTTVNWGDVTYLTQFPQGSLPHVYTTAGARFRFSLFVSLVCRLAECH